MKLIKLSNGMFAQLDDDDHALQSQYHWTATRTNGYYRAVRQSNGKLINLSREIMQAETGKLVVFIDNNSLNMQRSNMRIGNNSNATASRPRQPNNTSGYKGVSHRKDNGRWRATIQVDGVTKSLGSYDTGIEAALAYDFAARRYFGEFAVVNFPDKK